ncbi:hypothetical protein [Paramicrobacterium chengjingii]|uniref:hypothetical protein n=1 Tax=Paramicrobacterium chengjingii TaxID=2769067 RepID=UPI0014241448|nr:hypothetical protein [Microbacterium chengjingii]
MTDVWNLSYPGASLDMVADIDADVVLSSAPEISYGINIPEYVTDGVDGRTFGRGLQDGMTILFELDVNGRGNESLARIGKEQLRRVWRGDAVRQDVGSVATLRAPSGRVTFGVPQRYSANDTYMKQGLVRATVDFAATTDLWFSPEPFSTSVRIVPPPSGGFVAPFVFPLTSSGSANESALFTVGGEVPTWPVFEIAGPIQRPAVEVVGLFRLEYGGSLAYDEVLRIDTNPHVRSVTVNGAGVSLTPSSDRLLAASVPPGVHVLSLFGTSSSGTATATVRGNAAYTTY